MAAPGQEVPMSYWTTYTIGRAEDTPIGKIYDQIINYETTSSPFYKYGHLARFTQNHGELSNKQTFSLIKRLGFEVVKIFDWNGQETQLIEDTSGTYEFTDTEFVDGVRYMFAVSKDKKRMRIYKQILFNDVQTCTNTSDEETNIGSFVNITKYSYLDPGTGNSVVINYFPFGPCIADKFVVAPWAKGQIRSQGTNGVLEHELIGVDVLYKFHDLVIPTGSITWSAADKLYINGGAFCGQVNGIGSQAGNDLLMRAPWAGLYKVNPITRQVISTTTGAGTTTQTVDVNASYTLQQQESIHEWAIFGGYGDILHFATSDGIFHLHYSDQKPSQSVFTHEGNTFYNTLDNTLSNPEIISSFVSFNDFTVFYDVKDGKLQFGLKGELKFFYNSLNSTILGRDFDLLVPLQSVLMLFGPSKVGSITVMYLDKTRGSLDIDYQDISLNRGYFTKGSVSVDDGDIRVFTSLKKLQNLSIKTEYGTRVVTPIWTYQENTYESDLTILDRSKGDEVFMSSADKDTFIFINRGGNTKVLVLSIKHDFWHKWMVSGLNIRYRKDAAFFGQHIYHRGGKQDNGEHYKTTVTFSHGDITYSGGKMYHYLKMLLGYNSYITHGKTFLKTYYDYSGWHTELTNDHFWRTDWVQNIMKLWQTGNTGNVFKNFPIGILLRGGNGVGYTTPQIHDTAQEFVEWNNYTPVGETNSNPHTEFTIAKWCDIEVPLSVPANLIHFEITTLGDNEIEFLGGHLGRQAMDIDVTRMENVLTYHDNTLAGNSNVVLTEDSGISQPGLVF